MPKSPEEMLDSMIKNLEEKTGKNLEAWVKVARASNLAKHGQIVGFLKSDHGLGHGYANLVALNALKADDAPAAGGNMLMIPHPAWFRAVSLALFPSFAYAGARIAAGWSAGADL